MTKFLRKEFLAQGQSQPIPVEGFLLMSEEPVADWIQQGENPGPRGVKVVVFPAIYNGRRSFVLSQVGWENDPRNTTGPVSEKVLSFRAGAELLEKHEIPAPLFEIPM